MEGSDRSSSEDNSGNNSASDNDGTATPAANSSRNEGFGGFGSGSFGFGGTFGFGDEFGEGESSANGNKNQSPKQTPNLPKTASSSKIEKHKSSEWYSVDKEIVKKNIGVNKSKGAADAVKSGINSVQSNNSKGAMRNLGKSGHGGNGNNPNPSYKMNSVGKATVSQLSSTTKNPPHLTKNLPNQNVKTDELKKPLNIKSMQSTQNPVPKSSSEMSDSAPDELAKKRISSSEFDIDKAMENSVLAQLDFNEDKIGKDSNCGVCHEEGFTTLFYCGRCPKAYHLDCYIPSQRQPPPKGWTCLMCKSHDEVQEISNKPNKESGNMGDRDLAICQRLMFEMHSIWPESLTFKDSSDLEFEEYKQVVKNPIALDTIKERLKKDNPNQYFTISEFLGDVRKMFHNCKTFHQKGTVFYSHAKTLEEHFLKNAASLARATATKKKPTEDGQTTDQKSLATDASKAVSQGSSTQANSQDQKTKLEDPSLTKMTLPPQNKLTNQTPFKNVTKPYQEEKQDKIKEKADGMFGAKPSQSSVTKDMGLNGMKSKDNNSVAGMPKKVMSMDDVRKQLLNKYSTNNKTNEKSSPNMLDSKSQDKSPTLSRSPQNEPKRDWLDRPKQSSANDFNTIPLPKTSIFSQKVQDLEDDLMKHIGSPAPPKKQISNNNPLLGPPTNKAPISKQPQPSGDRKEVGNKKKDSTCTICNEHDDTLYKCSMCPKAYHGHCYIPSIIQKPDPDWQCLMCYTKDDMLDDFGPEEKLNPNKLSELELKTCQRLWLELHSKNPEGIVFADSQDLEFEAYRKKIKDPIALDLIRERLEEDHDEQYKTVSDFLYDVRRMLFNCKTFHGSGTLYYKHARNMEDFLKKLLLEWFPKLAHDKYEPKSESKNPTASKHSDTSNFKTPENPKPKKKNKDDEDDSGSDYNPSGSEDDDFGWNKKKIMSKKDINVKKDNVPIVVKSTKEAQEIRSNRNDQINKYSSNRQKDPFDQLLESPSYRPSAPKDGRRLGAVSITPVEMPIRSKIKSIEGKSNRDFESRYKEDLGVSKLMIRTKKDANNNNYYRRESEPEDDPLATQTSSKDDEKQEDFCTVCDDGGDLTGCDKCPRVYHLDCYVPKLTEDPPDDWTCLMCVSYDEVQQYPNTIKKGGSKLGNRDLKICRRILLEVYAKHPESSTFADSADIDFKEYKAIIKEPIALDIIKSKLDKNNSKQYSTTADFIVDLRKMFVNCKTYNDKGDDVYIHAQKLEAHLDKVLDQWLPHATSQKSSSKDLAKKINASTKDTFDKFGEKLDADRKAKSDLIAQLKDRDLKINVRNKSTDQKLDLAKRLGFQRMGDQNENALGRYKIEGTRRESSSRDSVKEKVVSKSLSNILTSSRRNTSTEKDAPRSSRTKTILGYNEDKEESGCTICHEDGDVQYSCNNIKCSRSFHPTCYIPEMKSKLPSNWICILCVSSKELQRLSENQKPGKRGMNERDTKICQRLYIEMRRKKPECDTFKDSGDLDFAAYRKVIKEPVALDIIKYKLQDDGPVQYANFGEFMADVRKMFENCRTYNRKETRYHRHANALEEYLDKIMQDWCPDKAEKYCTDSSRPDGRSSRTRKPYTREISSDEDEKSNEKKTNNSKTKVPTTAQTTLDKLKAPVALKSSSTIREKLQANRLIASNQDIVSSNLAKTAKDALSAAQSQARSFLDKSKFLSRSNIDPLSSIKTVSESFLEQRKRLLGQDLGKRESLLNISRFTRELGPTKSLQERLAERLGRDPLSNDPLSIANRNPLISIKAKPIAKLSITPQQNDRKDARNKLESIAQKVKRGIRRESEEETKTANDKKNEKPRGLKDLVKEKKYGKEPDSKDDTKSTRIPRDTRNTKFSEKNAQENKSGVVSLPQGWIKDISVRKGGGSAGTTDTYIISPSGKKFRSKNELKKYFDEGTLPMSQTDMNTILEAFNKKSASLVTTQKSPSKDKESLENKSKPTVEKKKESPETKKSSTAKSTASTTKEPTEKPKKSVDDKKKLEERQDGDGDEDNMDDWCAVCHDGGDTLYGCDKCPKVYHPDCYSPVLTEEPPDDWQCIMCTTVDEVEELTNDKKVGRMGEKDSTICRRLLTTMMNMYPQSDTFKEIKDLKFKEYTDAIDEPMALDVITKKLNGDKYSTLSTFLSDVRLMFDNCRAFHGRGNDFYKDAKALEQHMHKTLQEFAPAHIYIFEEESKSSKKKKEQDKSSETKDDISRQKRNEERNKRNTKSNTASSSVEKKVASKNSDSSKKVSEVNSTNDSKIPKEKTEKKNDPKENEKSSYKKKILSKKLLKKKVKSGAKQQSIASNDEVDKKDDTDSSTRKTRGRPTKVASEQSKKDVDKTVSKERAIEEKNRVHTSHDADKDGFDRELPLTNDEEEAESASMNSDEQNDSTKESDHDPLSSPKPKNKEKDEKLSEEFDNKSENEVSDDDLKHIRILTDDPLTFLPKVVLDENDCNGDFSNENPEDQLPLEEKDVNDIASKDNASDEEISKTRCKGKKNNHQKRKSSQRIKSKSKILKSDSSADPELTENDEEKESSNLDKNPKEKRTNKDEKNTVGKDTPKENKAERENNEGTSSNKKEPSMEKHQKSKEEGKFKNKKVSTRSSTRKSIQKDEKDKRKCKFCDEVFEIDANKENAYDLLKAHTLKHFESKANESMNDIDDQQLTSKSDDNSSKKELEASSELNKEISDKETIGKVLNDGEYSGREEKSDKMDASESDNGTPKKDGLKRKRNSTEGNGLKGEATSETVTKEHDSNSSTEKEECGDEILHNSENEKPSKRSSNSTEEPELSSTKSNDDDIDNEEKGSPNKKVKQTDLNIENPNSLDNDSDTLGSEKHDISKAATPTDSDMSEDSGESGSDTLNNKSSRKLKVVVGDKSSEASSDDSASIPLSRLIGVNKTTTNSDINTDEKNVNGNVLNNEMSIKCDTTVASLELDQNNNPISEKTNKDKIGKVNTKKDVSSDSEIHDTSPEGNDSSKEADDETEENGVISRTASMESTKSETTEDTRKDSDDENHQEVSTSESNERIESPSKWLSSDEQSSPNMLENNSAFDSLPMYSDIE